MSLIIFLIIINIIIVVVVVAFVVIIVFIFRDAHPYPQAVKEMLEISILRIM